MASPPAEIREQAARNAAIVALARGELNKLWPRVDWSSTKAVDAVKTVYGAIIDRFGSAAASVAAETYDDLRSAQALSTTFRAKAADPVPIDQVDKIVESAFRGEVRVRLREPSEAPGPDQVKVSVRTTSDLPVDERVTTRLDSHLSKLVLQPARDTIAENTTADPAKPTWIRVPTGETTCEFCIMLASRELGPNFSGYGSKHTALFDENGDTFHKNCDCIAMPVYPGDNVHEISPNMADYQDLYETAANKAGTRSDPKKILAELRQQLKNREPSEPPAPQDEPLAPIDLDAPTPRERPEAAPGGGGGEPPQPPGQNDRINADDEDPVERMNGMFADQAAHATSEQRESVQRWQEPDEHFYRDVQLAATGDPTASAEARNVVDDLDALMDQLPEPVQVWRGVRNATRTFGVPSDQLESLRHEIMQVDRFFATSLSQHIAEGEFTDPGSDPVLYRITARTGTYALWVAPLGHPQEAYQQELLFPPGTYVRIVEVDRTYRVPIVDVEVW